MDITEMLREGAREIEVNGTQAQAGPSPVELRRAADRIAELEAAIRQEWLANHAEHCTNQWPHDGACFWPLPEVLQKST